MARDRCKLFVPTNAVLAYIEIERSHRCTFKALLRSHSRTTFDRRRFLYRKNRCLRLRLTGFSYASLSRISLM